MSSAKPNGSAEPAGELVVLHVRDEINHALAGHGGIERLEFLLRNRGHSLSLLAIADWRRLLGSYLTERRADVQ